MTHTGIMLHARTAKLERFRLLGGVREVSHERLLAMTTVDHVTTEHFLVFADGSDAIVVTAMVACVPSLTKAEVAICVRADDKHKGVGWEMLRLAAHYAQSRGVSTLEPFESRKKHEAIELEQEQDFITVPSPADPTFILVRKDLLSN